MRAIIALALAATIAATNAAAQTEQRWTAPNGAFSLTIPDMWNPQARSEPEVLLFLKSLQLGPSGPGAITCTIERYAQPSERAFTAEEVNALTQMSMDWLLRQESNLTPSTDTIDGVVVDSAEAVVAQPHGLSDHHFWRMFQRLEGQEFARYVLLCGVTTRSPGAEGDFAATRGFFSSLHINGAVAE